MKIGTRTIIITLAATLQAAPPIYADLNSGLVAYYPLNANADDASGNGHNGTVHGATWTTDRMGNANGAALFVKAEGDWIQSSGVNVSNSSFTVCAWAKRTMATSSYIFGIGSAAATDQSAHFGYLADTAINFDFYNNGLHTTTQYDDSDTWHFWGAVYDRSTGRRTIYLDGGNVAATDISPSPFLGTSVFFIGRDGHSLLGLFDGAIDDVRVYNRALSSQEIQQLAGIQSVCRSVPGNASIGVSFGNVLAGRTYNYSASGCVYMGGGELGQHGC